MDYHLVENGYSRWTFDIKFDALVYYFVYLFVFPYHDVLPYLKNCEGVRVKVSSMIPTSSGVTQ